MGAPNTRQMRRAIEQERTGVLYVDSTNVEDSAYYMSAEDLVIRATANTASDDYTLYLPPVVEAAGKFYAVHGTIANSKTITLADLDDSDDFDGDYTIDADNDGILLYSDGIRWWDVSNQISGG